MFLILNLVSSIRKQKQVIGNGINNFCILEINPFVLKFLTSALVIVSIYAQKIKCLLIWHKGIWLYNVGYFNRGLVEFPLGSEACPNSWLPKTLNSVQLHLNIRELCLPIVTFASCYLGSDFYLSCMDFKLPEFGFISTLFLQTSPWENLRVGNNIWRPSRQCK